MIKKDDPIIACLRLELPSILANRPIMVVYLYGSVASETAQPTSDIDIALVFEPGSGLSAYERTQLELNIAAQIENRCHVKEADVRSIDRAPIAVQGRVLAEGILLYSRDEEFRVQYEVLTRKRYFDFLPVDEMMRRAFFEQIRRKGVTGGKTRQD